MSFVVHRAPAVRESSRGNGDGPDGRQVVCSQYFRWKRWLSLLAAAVLLVPGLLLTGLLVVLVRLTSRGPGLYRQTRVGYQGRTFTLYKIRTMRFDAEATTGPVWTERDDPRITWLGRLLRRVHLDELPQLINVVRGEMSLIGPRPERPEFTQYLARQIPGYLDRYSVLPGITGLAQISLPPDSDVDSVRRKLVVDLEYIRTASLAMDLRILLCTALRLMGFPGMRVAEFLGLVRVPRIPEWMIPEPAASEVSGNGAPATYGLKLRSLVHAGNGKSGAAAKGGSPIG